VVLIKSRGTEEWAYQLQLDGFNGWKKLVRHPIELVQIDAGHLAPMKEPAVRTVVQRIDGLLRD
jgi:hypothetical protein